MTSDTINARSNLVPAWNPTCLQWLSWSVGHLTTAGWIATGVLIDWFRPDDLKPNQWTTGIVWQSLNLSFWILLAMSLNYAPMLSDRRLGLIWRLIGCITITITFLMSALIAILMAGGYAMTQTGLDGIQ